MSIVTMGKTWEINSREDYDKAMKTLEENDFIAEMSDDFSCWKREKAEVARQMAEVTAQARMKGII